MTPEEWLGELGVLAVLARIGVLIKLKPRRRFPIAGNLVVARAGCYKYVQIDVHLTS
jgi:hypothetical protein